MANFLNFMELKFILEAILFSAQKPMSTKELRDLLAATAVAENATEDARGLKKSKDEDLVGSGPGSWKSLGYRARGHIPPLA